MNAPHDTLFKTVFGNPQHAAAELRAVLPKEVSGQIDFSSLRLLPGSFVDGNQKRRHTDLLYSAKVADQPAYIYCLFEHQSSVDRFMVYRLLRYQVKIWEAFLRNHKGSAHLPVILPVVLYHGEGGWSAPTQLIQLLHPSNQVPALAPFIPDFCFILDDLEQHSNAELQSRQMEAFLQLVLWVMRDARNAGRLLANVAAWAPQFRAVRAGPDAFDALRLILEYIAQTTNEAILQELQEQVSTIDPNAEEFTMTTIAEHWRREGRQEGHQEGHQEGRGKGIIEGQQLAIIEVLEARGFVLSAQQRAQIEACTSAPTLSHWVRTAVTVQNVDQLFDVS